MDAATSNETIVNCLGAPWPEDLSAAFIDQLRAQGVKVVGCRLGTAHAIGADDGAVTHGRYLRVNAEV